MDLVDRLLIMMLFGGISYLMYLIYPIYFNNKNTDPTTTTAPTTTTTVPTTTTTVPTTSSYIQSPNCKPGYYDITNGKFNKWKCGLNCEGGANLVTNTCNCACQKIPITVPPDTITTLPPDTITTPTTTTVPITTTYNQSLCKVGYYDITNNNMKLESGGGSKCEGGEGLVNDKGECACKMIPINEIFKKMNKGVQDASNTLRDNINKINSWPTFPS